MKLSVGSMLLFLMRKRYSVSSFLALWMEVRVWVGVEGGWIGLNWREDGGYFGS